MIVIKVAELMGKHRMTQKQLAEITGIRPNTISTLWHGTTKRLEIEQIDKLCTAFNCKPGDLFDHIPNENQTDI